MKRFLAAFVLLFLASGALAQNPGIIYSGASPSPDDCAKFINRSLITTAGAPCASGIGTVSSVGLALPLSVFTVSGSPVTTSGTLTGSFTTQSANTLFAGPTTGVAAIPAFRALVAADVPSSILPGGFTGFANPSASVGLSAVNGVATTAMRSDAAPPLSQSITPTWTGAHTFSNTITLNSTINKLTLTAPATAATFTLANNKTFTVNNSLTLSGTDSTVMTFPTTTATIARTDAGQTFSGNQVFTPGANVEGISVQQGAITANTKGINLTATFNNSGVTFDAPLYVAVTNTASASGSRVVDILGGAAGTTSLFRVTTAGDATVLATLTAANVNLGGAGVVSWNSGATVTSPATATLQLGAAAAASPVAQTLQVQPVVAGNANVAGANWTIQGSLSNGSGGSGGGGGDIILKTTASVAASGSQNSGVEVIRLTSGTNNIKFRTSSTGAGIQTFTNSPCGTLATEQWIPVEITGQTGTWFVPACQ